MCGAVLAAVACIAAVSAQSARERRDQPTDKQLLQRADKAQETLLKELAEVAGEFQKQGLREQSLAILERIEKIDPQAPGVRERIELLRSELITQNGMMVEVDTSRGWGNALAEVEAGKTIRITAAGDYRLNLTATVPLTGLPTADPGRDHVKEAPFGALIGLIVSEGQPGTPFPVNASLDMVPKKGGVLFLRANVPLSAKCTGTIKVQLSGGVRPIPKAR